MLVLSQALCKKGFMVCAVIPHIPCIHALVSKVPTYQHRCTIVWPLKGICRIGILRPLGQLGHYEHLRTQLQQTLILQSDQVLHILQGLPSKTRTNKLQLVELFRPLYSISTLSLRRGRRIPLVVGTWKLPVLRGLQRLSSV